VAINRLLFVVVLMQALMVLTIGLQYGFKTLYWIATIPPIFIVAIFKIHLNRSFSQSFRYYTPSDEELRNAKVHSERADNKGDRLGKRFGHPSLHAELFTPMLHAKMMPLLSQVYRGRIGKDEAKLEEYGGQKMEAQIVEGGVKIAAIEQRDLEYDPALYRRDRGELDWDARSMTSTVLLSDTMTIAPSQGIAASNGPVPGYDRYLASGPGAYELTRMDSLQEPLLSQSGIYNEQGYASQHSLALPPAMYRGDSSNDSLSREAPLHRPQDRPQDYFGDYPRSNSPYMETRSATPVSQGQQYPPQSNQQYSTSHSQHPSQTQLSIQTYPPQEQQNYTRQSAYSPQQQHPPSQAYPPQEPQNFSRQSQPQRQQTSPQGYYPQETQDQNFAGRGVYRR